MLTINIPAGELFDDDKGEFITSKAQTLCLEHSLVSISKWESKWHKPFLNDKEQKTHKETIDYIRCMTITQNVDPNCYYFLTNKNILDVKAYIDDSMTATWFSEKKTSSSKRIITSEVIYYWMVALQIPFECKKWHLNRLLTLIKVCNEENKPQNKKHKNKRDFLASRAALNAARKKQLGTRG